MKAVKPKNDSKKSLFKKIRPLCIDNFEIDQIKTDEANMNTEKNLLETPEIPNSID